MGTRPNRPIISAPMDDYLRFDNLQKRFGDSTVTRGVTLGVGRSEIVALLGPSGSGKTTILRLVAGFEQPDSGRITVEGEDVTALPPERRRFGMVFQHYALFPHLTVGENVAFGLEAQGRPRVEVPGLVAKALAAVDLAGFEGRRVTAISGGQQQRVALARALAPEPRVLLLDEPLSNLDPALRERTRRELHHLIKRTGITTLFVTHEQEEAFDLGDRVAVLHAGRLEQVGTPQELYEEPTNRFVATFIGRSSVIPGTWEGPVRVHLPGGVTWAAEASEPLVRDEPVDVLVRPEGLAFAEPTAPLALRGEIVGRRYGGPTALFLVRLQGAGEVEVLAPSRARLVGQRVGIVPAPAGPAPRVYPREEI
jgi:ABC-type Fe3+/spermidine/putrescine transport system ATPase subunit